MNPSHFPRPKLAAEFADELMGKTPLSDALNGLFIAGERRTGKTQFMRLDLRPELEKRGLLVLYADLRVNVNLTPVEAVQQMLHQAVQENLGVLPKFAKSLGLEKVGVPGAIALDLKTVGKTDGLSVYQVLDTLHKATKKQIVLIIDEAQHALTSEEGEGLMWALKSARDQMKTAQGNDLMLVMSGSHTDKLNLLLNSPKAPFWGSQVRAMPKLENDYVQAYAAQVRLIKPEFSAVRTSELVKAFEHFGRRPQFFANALGQAANNSYDADSFEKNLIAEGQNRTRDDRKRFTDAFLLLSPLEKAVLERLIVQGRLFRGFDAAALAFYAEQTGEKVTTTQVQRAIDALRENDEDLVWKSSRGEYSIYDQGLVAWHAHLVAQREWPPQITD
jgi:hypothetical protein